MSPQVLLIDNYDSFTYNLVQQLEVEGARVTVLRNDRVEPADLDRIGATHLIISPGPGRPSAAGRSIEMVRAARGRVPVLGVCLGHQAIAESVGLEVGPARRLMHGKTSLIHHDGQGVFADLPNPFEAGRYHSLAVVDARIRQALQVSAWTDDGEVMAVRDPASVVVGVQFHPESILTPEGPRLLSNFLHLHIQGRHQGEEQPAEVARTAAGAVEGVNP